MFVAVGGFSAYSANGGNCDIDSHNHLKYGFIIFVEWNVCLWCIFFHHSNIYILNRCLRLFYIHFTWAGPHFEEPSWFPIKAVHFSEVFKARKSCTLSRSGVVASADNLLLVSYNQATLLVSYKSSTFFRGVQSSEKWYSFSVGSCHLRR